MDGSGVHQCENNLANQKLYRYSIAWSYTIMNSLRYFCYLTLSSLSSNCPSCMCSMTLFDCDPCDIYYGLGLVPYLVLYLLHVYGT